MIRKNTTKIIIELSGDEEHEAAEQIIDFAVSLFKSRKLDVEPHFISGFQGDLESYDKFRKNMIEEATEAGVHFESDIDSEEMQKTEWSVGRSPRKKSSSNDTDSILDSLFD